MSRGKWREPSISQFDTCNAILDCHNKPSYYRRTKIHGKIEVQLICKKCYDDVPTFNQDKFWNWRLLK